MCITLASPFSQLVSTFFIVIFGEIIPQATCSRYSLRVGAALIIPVKVCLCRAGVYFVPVSQSGKPDNDITPPSPCQSNQLLVACSCNSRDVYSTTPKTHCLSIEGQYVCFVFICVWPLQVSSCPAADVPPEGRYVSEVIIQSPHAAVFFWLLTIPPFFLACFISLFLFPFFFHWPSNTSHPSLPCSPCARSSSCCCTPSQSPSRWR